MQALYSGYIDKYLLGKAEDGCSLRAPFMGLLVFLQDLAGSWVRA